MSEILFSPNFAFARDFRGEEVYYPEREAWFRHDLCPIHKARLENTTFCPYPDCPNRSVAGYAQDAHKTRVESLGEYIPLLRIGRFYERWEVKDRDGNTIRWMWWPMAKPPSQYEAPRWTARTILECAENLEQLIKADINAAMGRVNQREEDNAHQEFPDLEVKILRQPFGVRKDKP